MNLKQYRLAKSLNQKEVAFQAGITRSYYANVEKGRRRPSPQVAQKIAEVLGFDWTLFYMNPDLEGVK